MRTLTIPSLAHGQLSVSRPALLVFVPASRKSAPDCTRIPCHPRVTVAAPSTYAATLPAPRPAPTPSRPRSRSRAAPGHVAASPPSCVPPGIAGIRLALDAMSPGNCRMAAKRTNCFDGSAACASGQSVERHQSLACQYGSGMRIQFLRLFNFFQRFRKSPQMQQICPVPIMGVHRIGI